LQQDVPKYSKRFDAAASDRSRAFHKSEVRPTSACNRACRYSPERWSKLLQKGHRAAVSLDGFPIHYGEYK
jgi:hypothetical protein